MSFLTSCRQGYKVENDKVYYEYWNEGSGQGKRLIEKADATTFQTVEFDCDCSFDFGKDKNHLFIDGEPINDIDPKTFKFVGNYIFADKDNAYFFGFYNNLNDCAIKGVKPSQIQLIKYPWAKAGNFLIHGHDTLYLDDICVDEGARGKGVGREIYSFVRDYAKRHNVYNITLNVWENNDSAKSFYEAMGLHVLKYGMEDIISDGKNL